MKKISKIFSLAVMLAVALLLFAACQETEQTPNPQEPVYYTVTFDMNGGTAVKSQTVRGGGRVYRPNDPVKDGFGFVDWYYEGEPYRFRNKVEGNLLLVAEWGPCEAVVSQKFDTPAGWDFATLSVLDASGAAAEDSLSISDGQFCFVNEGEYKIYALTPELIGQKVSELKKASKKGVYAISGISKQGLAAMLREAGHYIQAKGD